MKTHAPTIALALLASLAVSGCNGPTGAGQQARLDARTRINAASADLLFDQAQQSFEVGQFERAMTQVTHAILRHPDNAEYHVLQGRIFLETHRLQAAIDAFQTAMEKDADSAEAHYFAGIVHQRWSNHAQACEHYGQAAQLDETNVHYVMAMAESLVALDRLQEAESLLVSKHEYFEHNPAVPQLLGQIALLRGDAETAARLYGEARLLNPDDVTLLEELAYAQYDARQYGKCHASIKQLQSMSEEQRTDIMHLEAQCLAMLDRRTDARELYLELVQLRPAEPDIWVELGTIAWELGDYRRVALASVRLIALVPNRYEGYLLKGINEQHHGNSEEAIALFRQSAVRTESSPIPYLMLGQELDNQGHHESAAVMYRNALEIDPGCPEALALLEQSSEQRVTVVPTD